MELILANCLFNCTSVEKEHSTSKRLGFSQQSGIKSLGWFDLCNFNGGRFKARYD